MNIEQKIIFYSDIKWCIPFRALQQTIDVVCGFVKPICPEINTLKYFEFFFKEINFDKIDAEEPNKKEAIKNCRYIHYGLDGILKVDIGEIILNYQNGISNLSEEQITETKRELITVIGELKQHTQNIRIQQTFTQRYLVYINEISKDEHLVSVDYQILIAYFRDAMLKDLLGRYEIINETFKEFILSPSKQDNNKEPKNKHPTVFVNGYAYEFFEKLRSEIAIDKFVLANYSFIMQKMITAGLLIQTNHPKLIQFLDKEYQTDLGKKHIQFTTSTTPKKNAIYTRLYKEFQPKIESIL